MKKKSYKNKEEINRLCILKKLIKTYETRLSLSICLSIYIYVYVYLVILTINIIVNIAKNICPLKFW